FAIDAGDQMVGREDMVSYPEAALAVTSVGSLYGDLPTETILAMQPDLVVAGEILTAEQVEALKALGLTVFWQANPTDFEGLYQNIKDLGVLTGNSAKAEELVGSLQARVSAVTDKLADVAERPAVFYQLDSTDPANPWTSGGGTFIDYIITMAGGENIAADLGAYAQISTEDLITRNPDVILMGDALYGITAESVAARPGWNVITAVQENAIFAIDPYILSVPGPRLVDGLEETARLIHPDLFAK
ncbi:MAG: ABC transporter substrate-binding protein, partial [Anaerolineaceae bacterium]